MVGTSNLFPGVGYTQLGFQRDYFQKLAINWSTFGGGSVDGYQPDGIITFNTQTVMMYNLGSGSTNVLEYSFNGTTVHGELNPSNLTSFLVFCNRVVCKYWFRVQSGSTGPITVSVQAWSTP